MPKVPKDEEERNKTMEEQELRARLESLEKEIHSLCRKSSENENEILYLRETVHKLCRSMDSLGLCVRSFLDNGPIAFPML